MDTTATPSLARTLEEFAPQLRKIAANKSGTMYSPTFEGLAPEAQNLYQHAVKNILATCKDGDTVSYMARLANWRMKSLINTERIYAERITTESDFAEVDTDGDSGDMDSILEIVASDQIPPEDALIQREVANQFQLVLEGMKPEHQVIIRMLRDGFGLPEISDKLGISYDAVWKRLAKIREMFSQAGLTPNLIMA